MAPISSLESAADSDEECDFNAKLDRLGKIRLEGRGASQKVDSSVSSYSDSGRGENITQIKKISEIIPLEGRFKNKSYIFEKGKSVHCAL